MKHGKVLILAAVVFVALAVASTGNSLSSGIGRTTSPSLPSEGCNCHGEGGAASGEVVIYWRVDPNPSFYEAGKVYNISFGAAETPVEVGGPEQNKGGFNLRVNVGDLAAGEGYETYVQQLGNPQELAHTKEGDVQRGRDWNVTWKAPAEAAEPAIFSLWINTVDGSGDNNPGDRFNMGIFVIANEPGVALGGAARGPDPEHVGVNWLAHWVGIVSILAVVGTLLIYYFVLKFGESIHTTDHRDRKEK